MVSVVRCWKAEYQKCKHSILLYMHSMIPIICAAIFAGYYHISRWELATKISAYLEVLAVAFPFLIGIIVGLVVQIENQAGHYQLLLGTIPSRMATYIGKLGFLMICAFGATFLALGTFAALYRDAPASLYLKAGILLLITMLPIYLIHLFVGMSFGKGASMGLGIAGSLIAALMITGLGANIHIFIISRYLYCVDKTVCILTIGLQSIATINCLKTIPSIGKAQNKINATHNVSTMLFPIFFTLQIYVFSIFQI